MPSFNHADFIWAKGQPASRNQFISFERGLSAVSADSVTIHLFADTRYRLWVNEVFVGYGPGRFVTAHPGFDSWEIGECLKDDTNLIRVEVNYYGASSFQSMPDGKPGFIAWGGSPDGAIDLRTPGDWKARVHEAWASDAPLFSFAQNPAEICDTRVLAAELKETSNIVDIERLSSEDLPWKDLSPRSVSLPDYKAISPDQISLASPVEKTQTFGFQTTQEGFVKGKSSSESTQTFCDLAVFEERADHETWCFWSDLTLNGKELSVDVSTPLGNHGDAPVNLGEGWNLLEGDFEVLNEYWSYLLRIPDTESVSAHALPDINCSDVFCLSPVFRS